MEALANSLRTILPTKGIHADVTECIVEIVQAESDQMRLMTEGGSLWETVRTENKLYDVLHADASRNIVYFGR